MTDASLCSSYVSILMILPDRWFIFLLRSNLLISKQGVYYDKRRNMSLCLWKRKKKACYRQLYKVFEVEFSVEKYSKLKETDIRFVCVIDPLTRYVSDSNSTITCHHHEVDGNSLNSCRSLCQRVCCHAGCLYAKC